VTVAVKLPAWVGVPLNEPPLATKLAETDPPVVVEIVLGDPVIVKNGTIGDKPAETLAIAKNGVLGDVRTIELKLPVAALKEMMPYGKKPPCGTLPVAEEAPTETPPESAFSWNVPDPSVANAKETLVIA